MGSNVSTDINVSAAEAALSLPPGSSQEDIENAIVAIRRNKNNNKNNTEDNIDEEMNLRKEAILIPEDTEDIHIESNITQDEIKNANGLLLCETSDDTPAANTRYGKGKHWKRNQKKQQQKYETYKMKELSGNTNPNERTQEQRRAQVRPIIDKLTELQMNMSYPAIRELYKVLNQFIKTGEDTKFKIPFPEFSRKIKGELSNAPYIPCWVKLELD